MKIAYLVSRYPAVSHTFILNEIRALRSRGVEIDTYSVRRATPEDILGGEATAEAARTRNLLPPNVAAYAGALAWAVFTRPLSTFQAFVAAVGPFNVSPWQRLMWCFYFAEALLLARWLTSAGNTHLHVHFGNNGSNTAYLASIVSGIPFSMTLHGIDLEPYEQFRLPRKIAKAAFTVCISKFGKASMMLRTAPELWPKIRVIHCGLDDPTAPAPPPVTDQRRLLCVARLSNEKGHLVLFDALKLMQDEGQAFTCTLVGDGPLRQSLEARAKELGIAGALVFKGALPPDKVAACYAECDAVVLSSFAEGIPMVLMEAMTQRRPVVAPNLSSIAELVEHGVNGYLCPPGNARDLAAALARVLADPERARAMGDAGARTVATRFRLDTSAEKLDTLFRAAHASAGKN